MNKLSGSYRIKKTSKIVQALRILFGKSTQENTRRELKSVIEKKPTMLSYTQVMGLLHVQKDLEMTPLYCYQGKIEKPICFVEDTPLMKNVVSIEYKTKLDWIYGDERQNVIDTLNLLYKKYKEKKYITDEEIDQLKNRGYNIVTEAVPAVFIIAPKQQDKDIQNTAVVVKYGENKYLRVDGVKDDVEDDIDDDRCPKTGLFCFHTKHELSQEDHQE